MGIDKYVHLQVDEDGGIGVWIDFLLYSINI